MKKIKSLFAISGALVVTAAPLIAVVSCGSGDPKPIEPENPVGFDESLEEASRRATEEKEANRLAFQTKIDNFVIDTNLQSQYAPTLSVLGQGKTVDELVTTFQPNYFTPFTTPDGLLGSVVAITKNVDDSIDATIEVSSTFEGVISKSYHETMILSGTNLVDRNAAINAAKNQMQTAVVPDLVADFDKTAKTSSQVFPSSFVPQKEVNNVTYKVVSVSNQTDNGSVLLTVYAYSHLLESLNDPNVPFEKLFDVSMDGFRVGAVHVNDPITWDVITHDPKYADPNVYYVGGIHRYAFDMAMSMVMDLAKDLGWEWTVEAPVPDAQGIYTPDVQSDIDGYNALLARQADPALNAKNMAAPHVTPYLYPMADDFTPTNGDFDKAGISHPSGVKEITYADAIKYTKVETINYAGLSDIGRFATWISYKNPGVVFMELEQKGLYDNKMETHPRFGGQPKPFNSEAYEWFLQSPAEFARHDYPIISMQDSAIYIDILENIIRKLNVMGSTAQEAAEQAAPARMVSEDWVDMMNFFSDLPTSQIPNRDWIRAEFEKMNNGTYNWAAIEIFARGMSGVPEQFRGNRNAGNWWIGQPTIQGFYTVSGFTQLLKWTSQINSSMVHLDGNGNAELWLNDEHEDVFKA